MRLFGRDAPNSRKIFHQNKTIVHLQDGGLAQGPRLAVQAPRQVVPEETS